jgi:leucyl/phenylalanyl-tRNA--protein transferase
LNRLGFAHSVETWLDGKLVGGLYGVHIGGLFAGESMFSRVEEASKVALVHLTYHLRERGFMLHDVQFMTPHLRRFGAKEITREHYQRRLAQAIKVNSKW